MPRKRANRGLVKSLPLPISVAELLKANILFTPGRQSPRFVLFPVDAQQIPALTAGRDAKMMTPFATKTIQRNPAANGSGRRKVSVASWKELAKHAPSFARACGGSTHTQKNARAF
jgi:hypothetical protein